MPKTTKTTVNQSKDGQYQTTIPKALGDALGLKDKRVEWTVESSQSLSMKVVEE